MALRARWLRRVLIGLVVCGVAVWLIIPMVTRALIRSRLQAMIADQLDAKLDIGDLVYHAPFGVSVIDASLVAPGPDGKPLELLRVPRLELHLARSPFASGPLLIERLVITDPAVHLIRTREGIVGCKVRSQADSPSSPPPKLSDVLRLTRFSLQGGQIIYEDRTRDAVPLVWRNLNVDLDTSRQADASYSYHLKVDNSPLATLEASGAANLDDLVLRVEKCALSVNVDPNTKESALSAEIQEPLRAWRVRGTVNLDVSGTLPLRDPAASTYRTALQLSHAGAQVPGWQTALENCTLKLVLTDGSEQPVAGRPAYAPGERPTARIELAEGSAGDAGFRLHDGLAVVDASEWTWKLTGLGGHVDPGQSHAALLPAVREVLDRLHVRGAVDFALDASGPLRSQDLRRFAAHLSVTPHDFSIQPPGLEGPVDGIGPLAVSLRDGTLTLEGVRAACGASHLAVKQARVSFAKPRANDATLQLADALSAANLGKAAFNLTGVTGHIDPAGSRAALPPALREQLDRLHIHGAVDLKLDASGLMQAKDLSALAGRLELTPVGFSLQPPGVDRPIDGITPLVISAANGSLTLEAARGACGGNLLYVKQARVALDGFPQKVQVSDLSGCLTFGPEQKYPPALAAALDPYRPVGPFFVGGKVSVDTTKPHDKVGYDLQIHTTRGRLSLTDRRIPITNIDTIVDVTPNAAVISRFEATAFNGSASATGLVGLQGRTTYQVTAALRNVDLRDLGQHLADPGQAPPPLSGRAVVTAKLAGTIPGGKESAYQRLTGSGEFEIRDGDFWRIPLFKSVSDSVSVKQAMTVGEAAGQFHISNGKIHFDRALASAPLLGVEGSGDVDLNGNMDFKLIADVLGQWSERVGDVGDGGGVAKLLDAVQHGVNVATRQALYQVVVTGSASKPQSRAIPAPFLTEQVSRLLGATMDQSRKTGLLDTLHNDPAPTTAPGGAK